MEYRASLRNAPISAQKCRLVADMIRGKPAGPALEALEFSRQKAGGILHKLLFSAMSNAENNHGADPDDLTVATVEVGEGLRFGRIRPRARGRASRYLKHHCNIRLVLSDDEGAGAPALAAPPAPPVPAEEDAPSDGEAAAADDGGPADDAAEEAPAQGEGEGAAEEGGEGPAEDGEDRPGGPKE